MQAAEAYVTALQLADQGANLTVKESDLAVAAFSRPRESLTQGLGFAASPGDSESEESSVDVFYDTSAVPDSEWSAYVKLPASVGSLDSSSGESATWHQYFQTLLKIKFNG